MTRLQLQAAERGETQPLTRQQHVNLVLAFLAAAAAAAFVERQLYLQTAAARSCSTQRQVLVKVALPCG